MILTGDAETLAGVNSISIAKLDLSKIDGALTETYKIVLPNDTESTDGVKEATLTLELRGLGKKTVSIEQSNITCTNVSEGYQAVVMNGSLDNVVIRGPEQVLRGITENNVRAVACMKEIQARRDAAAGLEDRKTAVRGRRAALETELADTAGRNETLLAQAKETREKATALREKIAGFNDEIAALIQKREAAETQTAAPSGDSA